jgi:citronellol/citronellal dehydrogenase
MADAAHAILSTTGMALTGQTLIDDDILRQRGKTDFRPYAWEPDMADRLSLDLYVDN